jgi:IS5 family transposase
VLHGQESDVFADAGYTGADQRPEHEDRDVCWNIAIKRSIIKALPKGLRELAEPVALAQVRAWVEPPFHIVKNLFRHKKLRDRGLKKNTAHLHTLFALANLVIVKKTLLVQWQCYTYHTTVNGYDAGARHEPREPDWGRPCADSLS